MNSINHFLPRNSICLTVSQMLVVLVLTSVSLATPVKVHVLQDNIGTTNRIITTFDTTSFPGIGIPANSFADDGLIEFSITAIGDELFVGKCQVPTNFPGPFIDSCNNIADRAIDRYDGNGNLLGTIDNINASLFPLQSELAGFLYLPALQSPGMPAGVVRIDPDTGERVSTNFDLPQGITSFDSTGAAGFIATVQNRIVTLNRDGMVIQSFELPPNLLGTPSLAVDESAEVAYFTSGNALAQFDLANDQLQLTSITELDFLPKTRSLTYSEETGSLYSAAFSRGHEFSTSGKLIRTFFPDNGLFPVAIAVTTVPEPTVFYLTVSMTWGLAIGCRRSKSLRVRLGSRER